MSVLIICEKPSVAKTVALALGAAEQKDGYLSGDGLLVSWCIGHLISMADAGSYDERYKKWRYEDLPILPQAWKYAPTPGKEKQLAVLKELLHRSDVSEVVNGCDAGREGELIFRYIYEKAGCKKPFDRLWISSMTDEAIQEGFRAIRSGSALAEAMSQADDDRELARFYRRKTTSLRLKLWLKTIKRWFMYTPWVRHIIMRLGLAAIHVEQENK